MGLDRLPEQGYSYPAGDFEDGGVSHGKYPAYRAGGDSVANNNLSEWLKAFGKEKAPIVVKHFERRLKAVRKKKVLGHDVLRHTFISMHVAKFKRVGAKSLQAGNSESIVRRHYLKMVAENEAKEFWAIRWPTKEEFAREVEKQGSL